MSGTQARGARLAVIAAVALVLPACTAVQQPTPSASSSEFGVLGVAGCKPPSPVLGAEVEATTSPGVTAYGLLFADSPTSLPGDSTPIKMVVRMTGAAAISGGLVAPDGREVPLDWGPEIHGESSYDRPGAEWGMGFSFDQPGCWQVQLDGGDSAAATFWFSVGG